MEVVYMGRRRKPANFTIPELIEMKVIYKDKVKQLKEL
jgi:hypothetical protein